MSASAESSSSMAIDKKENESDSEEEIIILDLPKMKLELMQKTKECQERGLAHSYKWLSEIRYSIRYVANTILSIAVVRIYWHTKKVQSTSLEKWIVGT